MLLTGSLTAERAAELRAEQSRQAPTYAELGASLTASFPPGYHHDRYDVALPTDPRAFGLAGDGLRQWVAHRGAGVEVTPNDVGLVEGDTVVLALPLGPVRAIAACRIVRVVDEPDRFGFAYGTLPLHPEQGEESFVIERDVAGVTRFTIRVFSRPRDFLARIGAPVSRTIQRRVTNGYLDAMRSFVEAGLS